MVLLFEENVDEVKIALKGIEKVFECWVHKPKFKVVEDFLSKNTSRITVSHEEPDTVCDFVRAYLLGYFRALEDIV